MQVPWPIYLTDVDNVRADHKWPGTTSWAGVKCECGKFDAAYGKSKRPWQTYCYALATLFPLQRV